MTKTVVANQLPVAGGTVAWDVTVTNAGPEQAENTWVFEFEGQYLTLDHIDGGCDTNVPNQAPSLCRLGTLDAGTSRTIRVYTNVDADMPVGTTVSNTVHVAAYVQESSYDDNVAIAQAGPRQANVAIDKEAQSAAPVIGSTIEWAITVDTQGSAANEVVVTDPVPDGTTFVSGPRGCGASAGDVVTCELGDLDAGDIWTGTLVGRIGSNVPVGEVLVNTASVVTSSGDTDPSDNFASAAAKPVVGPVGVRDLAVNLKVSPERVQPGETFTANVATINRGAQQAAGVVTRVEAPAGARVVRVGKPMPSPRSVRAPLPCRSFGSGVVCRFGTLAADATLVVPVKLRASAGALAGTRLKLSVTVSATSADDVADNDVAHAQVIVVQRAVPSSGVQQGHNPPPQGGVAATSSPSVLPNTGTEVGMTLPVAGGLLVLIGAALCVAGLRTRRSRHG